jgi:lactate permease
MNWTSLSLSLVPIAALVVALSVFKAKAYKATAGAAGLALVLALAFFRPSFPASAILPTVADGVSFALYPICLVVLAALFVYSLTVESGALKKIREGLSEVSPDPRVLAILVVWGFGNFMEGMAGFGTAVAIPAAILVGVGFDPLKSVLICLVANTTPTAFGSVGVPLVTLSKVGGTDLATLARTAVFLQLFVTALGPFLILLVLDGWKGLRGAVRLALMADAAFLVPWFLSARLLGPELPDILGGLSVLIVVSLWERKGRLACDLKAQVKAWAPFGFVVLFLGAAALLPAAAKRYAPSGVLILLAGFLGGASQGLSFGRMCRVLKKTLVSYWTAFVTIVFVLVLARVMTVSGMVATLADSLVAATGSAYPFFAPVVGALGGFVTGSGTSACVLFGPLQAGAAAKLGVAPDLLAAANVMGAGIGKMICPQSVAIGTAAALVADRAGDAFKRMLPWFFAVLLLACLVVCVSAR